MVPLSPCRLVLLQMPQEVDLLLCSINVGSSSLVYGSAQALYHGPADRIRAVRLEQSIAVLECQAYSGSECGISLASRRYPLYVVQSCELR